MIKKNCTKKASEQQINYTRKYIKGKWQRIILPKKIIVMKTIYLFLSVACARRDITQHENLRIFFIVLDHSLISRGKIIF